MMGQRFKRKEKETINIKEKNVKGKNKIILE